ncbi:hypothetical protein DLM75_17840 [Leptospira stimsonii]|uniref:Uncharacterized protein n=1 Tax=Leptospira stimsonii TaxID=2202203 RepID=A0A396YXP7_9LEPT|nr:hypothetical protein DLM75_17840 [Leptospira stimsonii]
MDFFKIQIRYKNQPALILYDSTTKKVDRKRVNTERNPEFSKEIIGNSTRFLGKFEYSFPEKERF